MVNIAIPFLVDFEDMENVQELNVKLNALEDNIDDFLEFLKTYSKKRVNIELVAGMPANYVSKALLEANPNIVFKLNEGFLEKLDEVKSTNIPFFFDLVAVEWDTFKSLCELGVRDVYIGDALGFAMKKLAKAKDRYKVGLRAYLNTAQASAPIDSQIKFFIRPEDIDMYADIITSFELTTNIDKVQLETLYHIYKYDKSWPGDLSILIQNLEPELIFGDAIIPGFADYRFNCQKKCLHSSDCSLCYTISTLSKTLSESAFAFEFSDEELEDIVEVTGVSVEDLVKGEE